MGFVALQIFKAVADCGGINAAARKLNRVQSNVTTRIGVARGRNYAGAQGVA